MNSNDDLEPGVATKNELEAVNWRSKITERVKSQHSDIKALKSELEAVKGDLTRLSAQSKIIGSILSIVFAATLGFLLTRSEKSDKMPPKIVIQLKKEDLK